MAEGHDPVALRFRGPVVEARAAASLAAASGMSVTWTDGDDGFASFLAVGVDRLPWDEAVALVEAMSSSAVPTCAGRTRRRAAPCRSRWTSAAARRA